MEINACIDISQIITHLFHSQWLMQIIRKHVYMFTCLLSNIVV